MVSLRALTSGKAVPLSETRQRNAFLSEEAAVCDEEGAPDYPVARLSPSNVTHDSLFWLLVGEALIS